MAESATYTLPAPLLRAACAVLSLLPGGTPTLTGVSLRQLLRQIDEHCERQDAEARRGVYLPLLLDHDAALR